MELITHISQKLAEIEQQKIELSLGNKPVSNTPSPLVYDLLRQLPILDETFHLSAEEKEILNNPVGPLSNAFALLKSDKTHASLTILKECADKCYPTAQYFYACRLSKNAETIPQSQALFDTVLDSPWADTVIKKSAQIMKSLSLKSASGQKAMMKALSKKLMPSDQTNIPYEGPFTSMKGKKLSHPTKPTSLTKGPHSQTRLTPKSKPASIKGTMNFMSTPYEELPHLYFNTCLNDNLAKTIGDPNNEFNKRMTELPIKTVAMLADKGYPSAQFELAKFLYRRGYPEVAITWNEKCATNPFASQKMVDEALDLYNDQKSKPPKNNGYGRGR